MMNTILKLDHKAPDDDQERESRITFAPSNASLVNVTSDNSIKNEKLKFMLLLIMEQIIDQTHVLCRGKYTDNCMALFSATLKDRGKKTTPQLELYDPIYDMESGEPYKDHFKKIQLDKIITDSVEFKEFLLKIAIELQDHDTFGILKETLHEVKEIKKSHRALLKNKARNYKKMKDLRHYLASQGIDCRANLHKVNLLFESSCDSAQVCFFTNMTRIKYAKEYENSRQQQNQLICERDTKELINIIETYKRKTEIELRVHLEILTYIECTKQEMQIEINNWIKKFNIDTEHRNLEIYKIKERQSDKQAELEALQVLYAEHKKAVEDYKVHKKLEEQRIAKELERNKAATVIQAWWRGIRFRRKYGTLKKLRKKMEKAAAKLKKKLQKKKMK